MIANGTSGVAEISLHETPAAREMRRTQDKAKTSWSRYFHRGEDTAGIAAGGIGLQVDAAGGAAFPERGGNWELVPLRSRAAPAHRWTRSAAGRAPSSSLSSS